MSEPRPIRHRRISDTVVLSLIQGGGEPEQPSGWDMVWNENIGEVPAIATHDVDVTHIHNHGGDMNYYIAECSCGWSGGKFYRLLKPAQEQADKHRETAR